MEHTSLGMHASMPDEFKQVAHHAAYLSEYRVEFLSGHPFSFGVAWGLRRSNPQGLDLYG